MSSTKDLDILNQIEKCLYDFDFGYSNPAAIKKIDGLLHSLSPEFQFYAYVKEKIVSIKSFAKILYSDRKHNKYPGGAERVRDFILGDCSRLTRYLSQISNT